MAVASDCGRQRDLAIARRAHDFRYATLNETESRFLATFSVGCPDSQSRGWRNGARCPVDPVCLEVAGRITVPATRGSRFEQTPAISAERTLWDHLLLWSRRQGKISLGKIDAGAAFWNLDLRRPEDCIDDHATKRLALKVPVEVPERRTE